MITTCPECGDYTFNPPIGDPIIVYCTEWQSCVCGFHLFGRKLFKEIERISASFCDTKLQDVNFVE